MNPDAEQAHAVEVGPLIAATGGTFRTFTDVTPLATPVAFEPGTTIALEPLEIRVFRGDGQFRAIGREVRPLPPGAEAASRRALDELAANRIAIEQVYPEIDGGRFPIKRVVGDVLEVWADIFADGHDKLQARVTYRTRDHSEWHEAPMLFFDNDRWVGRFPLTENTDYLYTIAAWRDLFGSWCADLVKKRDAGRDLRLELEEGRVLIEKAAGRADGRDREFLASVLTQTAAIRDQPHELTALLLGEELHEAVVRCAERTNLSRYPIELRVTVDRQAALFSAWYELFPRSQSGTKARGGTFDDVIARLPYVRDMGFDVLYFPPIHPIGRTNRKGRNNSLVTRADDPGSPY
ncbi:MAG: maltotransferase domain-containing protein, partial [Dongiaceae bacterium]